MLYICSSIQSPKELFKKLGKHKTGVGCLYINKLEDVNTIILKNLIESSYKKNKAIGK